MRNPELERHVTEAARVAGWAPNQGSDRFAACARLTLSACGLRVEAAGKLLLLYNTSVLFDGKEVVSTDITPNGQSAQTIQDHWDWLLGDGCAACGEKEGAIIVHRFDDGPRGRQGLCRECRDLLGPAPSAIFLGDAHPVRRNGLGFAGKTGDYLRSVMQMDHETFYQQVLAVNLRPDWECPRPSQMSELAFTRLHFWELSFSIPPHLPIFAFGRTTLLGAVGREFPDEKRYGFPVYIRDEREIYYVPFPTSRSHEWSDPKVQENFLRLTSDFDLT